MSTKIPRTMRITLCGLFFIHCVVSASKPPETSQERRASLKKYPLIEEMFFDKDTLKDFPVIKEYYLEHGVFVVPRGNETEEMVDLATYLASVEVEDDYALIELEENLEAQLHLADIVEDVFGVRCPDKSSAGTIHKFIKPYCLKLYHEQVKFDEREGIYKVHPKNKKWHQALSKIHKFEKSYGKRQEQALRANFRHLIRVAPERLQVLPDSWKYRERNQSKPDARRAIRPQYLRPFFDSAYDSMDAITKDAQQWVLSEYGVWAGPTFENHRIEIMDDALEYFLTGTLTREVEVEELGKIRPLIPKLFSWTSYKTYRQLWTSGARPVRPVEEILKEAESKFREPLLITKAQSNLLKKVEPNLITEVGPNLGSFSPLKRGVSLAENLCWGSYCEYDRTGKLTFQTGIETLHMPYNPYMSLNRGTLWRERLEEHHLHNTLYPEYRRLISDEDLVYWVGVDKLLDFKYFHRVRVDQSIPYTTRETIAIDYVDVNTRHIEASYYSRYILTEFSLSEISRSNLTKVLDKEMTLSIKNGVLSGTSTFYNPDFVREIFGMSSHHKHIQTEIPFARGLPHGTAKMTTIFEQTGETFLKTVEFLNGIPVDEKKL